MSVDTKQTDFGRLVRSLLAERGLKHEFLARQIGIAPASLSRVLGGGRPPSADLVLRISAALQLTLEDQQKLLAAAGYGVGGPSGTADPGRAGRRRRPGHFAPLPVVDDEESQRLRDVVRRLEQIEREAAELREIVVKVLAERQEEQ